MTLFICMMSSILWDITSCCRLKVNWGFRGIYHLCLQGWRISQAWNHFSCHLFSCCSLAWLILWSWRWRRDVPLKRRLTLSGLHSVITWKTVLFVTITVRTTNPRLFTSNFQNVVLYGLSLRTLFAPMMTAKCKSVPCAQCRNDCRGKYTGLACYTHFLFSKYSTFLSRSQDNIVGIVTGYGLDDQGVGVSVLVGSRIFSSPCRSDWLRSIQPPTQWVLGAPPGVKWPGREFDHSPPTSAKVKKTWIYTSTPPYIFMS
jgi:hypothetical protein